MLQYLYIGIVNKPDSKRLNEIEGNKEFLRIKQNERLKRI